jgi:hypothetical protein
MVNRFCEDQLLSTVPFRFVSYQIFCSNLYPPFFIAFDHLNVDLDAAPFIVTGCSFFYYLSGIIFYVGTLEGKSEGFCGRMKEYEFCRLERM